jgi:hypothetical protein
MNMIPIFSQSNAWTIQLVPAISFYIIWNIQTNKIKKSRVKLMCVVGSFRILEKAIPLLAIGTQSKTNDDDCWGWTPSNVQS